MCTVEKRGNIFILTLIGDGEHRLNPTLINLIRSHIRQISSESAAALVTTATGKFFSNGYDLDWANSVGSGSTSLDRIQLMSLSLRSLVTDLISLPMPTIAAVTGHASAAGMVLAMSHDYVVMRKDRGFMYMSELDIGLPLSAWFVALLRSKVKSPADVRNVALASKKLTADMASDMGIVDVAHEGVESTIEGAVKLGEELVKKKWDGQVYARIRKVLKADVLNAVGFDETVEDPSNTNKYVSRL